MCYSVLEELMQVRECEASRNRKLPRPYYLFVQKYGRSMEAEMPEIARLLGNGRWFLFSTEGKKKDVSMTSRFLVEQVSVLQVEFRILEVRMDYIVRS